MEQADILMGQIDILKIAVERTAAINTYWNIFIGVATATLGVFASGKELSQSRAAKILLTIGFSVFAWSNIDAIGNLNRQRVALADLLTDPSIATLVAELRPYPSLAYWVFHGILDLVVIGAIWFAPWPDNRKKPAGITTVLSSDSATQGSNGGRHEEVPNPAERRELPDGV